MATSRLRDRDNRCQGHSCCALDHDGKSAPAVDKRQTLPRILCKCYEGERVIICPGHFFVDGMFSIADSAELEGYGLPDNVHDAVEGILNIHHGKTTLENCVLQCETTGIRGAGVEIYPGSACTLLHNEIHHCKEGIVVKNFLYEDYEAPRITMVNNMIHNNKGYGLVLVRPVMPSEMKDAPAQGTKGCTQPAQNIRTGALNQVQTHPACYPTSGSDKVRAWGVQRKVEACTDISPNTLHQLNLRGLLRQGGILQMGGGRFGRCLASSALEDGGQTPDGSGWVLWQLQGHRLLAGSGGTQQIPRKISVMG
ncbi:hypothetical protein DV515_00000732, partial [Chloebia gouldiae]